MLRRNWRMIFVALSIMMDVTDIALTGVIAYYLRNYNV